MLSESDHVQFSMLSEQGLQRIDSICDQFEKAISSNEKPKIEEFLDSPSESENECVLRELLHLELAQSTAANSLVLTEYLSLIHI